MEQFMTTAVAAKLCGVSPRQLRHWEKMGYIPAPSRANYGSLTHRQFTEKDLHFIRMIKNYLDEGYTLAPAARIAARKIKNREVIQNEKK